MNAHRHLTAIFLLTAMSLSTTVVCAQQHERIIRKKFDVSENVNVRVKGKIGPVRIKGGDKNTVQVEVIIAVKDENAARAKQVADETEVLIDGGRNEVRVEVDWSDGYQDEGKRSLNMSIMCTVPKKSVLLLENKFGRVIVSDVEGSISIDNGFGSVEVTRCSNVAVENSFGGTTLNSVRGSLQVKSKNGKVRAFDMPAGEITNAFGSIDVSEAKGPVTIISRMGAVTAKGIPGGRIKSSYGSVTVALNPDFSGTVEAKTKFGAVDSEIPLSPRSKRRESGYGPAAEDLVGQSGTGDDRLIVVAEFGDVTIRKK